MYIKATRQVEKHHITHHRLHITNLTPETSAGKKLHMMDLTPHTSRQRLYSHHIRNIMKLLESSHHRLLMEKADMIDLT